MSRKNFSIEKTIRKSVSRPVGVYEFYPYLIHFIDISERNPFR